MDKLTEIVGCETKEQTIRKTENEREQDRRGTGVRRERERSERNGQLKPKQGVCEYDGKRTHTRSTFSPSGC